MAEGNREEIDVHVCKYCERIITTAGALATHEPYCKLNPDRTRKKNSKNAHRPRGLPPWNKGLTKEDNRVLAGVNKRKESIATGRYVPVGTPHTDQFKVRQSERAMARRLGGHTSKKQIFYKQINGDEVFLQSSYEIRFAELLDELGIKWERPKPFLYIGSDGKKHRYYPDFRIQDTYVDTKNDYLAVKDLPKINAVREQHKLDLMIVTEKDITKEFILATFV